MLEILCLRKALALLSLGSCCADHNQECFGPPACRSTGVMGEEASLLHVRS